MPTFSIIMPIYNACQINDKYLLEALESIRNQTYQDIELIIVNDGSIDKSEKVIKDYISHHPEICIQYYYKENGGQSHARNFGANFTRGEYLCFLDQDDLWAENKLELIASQLDEDTDLLYTDADIINVDELHTGIRREGAYLGATVLLLQGIFYLCKKIIYIKTYVRPVQMYQYLAKYQ